MNSFLKSKLQTVVVIFITVSAMIMSENGWSEGTPATPVPAPAASAPFQQYQPTFIPGKNPEELKREKEWEDGCLKKGTRSSKEYKICMRQEFRDHMDPQTKEVQCASLRDKMAESIRKCPPKTCQEAVNICTGETGSESESIINALLITTTGFNINPTNSSNVTNCEITYSDYRTEQREKKTDVETVQKEMNTLNNTVLKDKQDFDRENREVVKSQKGLRKEQLDLEKAGKAKIRDNSKNVFDTQMKLDEQVSQINLSIGTLTSQLIEASNNKKRMLMNFDISNINRICRGQILKGRSDECSKNPKSCEKIVNTALGSAFTTGGTRTADRNAEFDSCVKNTVMEYSQKIDSAGENLKAIRAQISIKNESLERAKEAQQKNTQFMMQELEDMKADDNREVQRIAMEYQDLEKELQERQMSYNAKNMENLRQQTELRARLAMASSAANQLGTRPKRIGKDLTGSEAIGEISNQESYRVDAKRLECCLESSNSELCKDLDPKKSGNRGPKSGTSAAQ